MSWALRLSRAVACVIAGGVAAACDGTIYRKDMLGDLDTLSIDARQRLVLVGQYHNEHGGGRAVCTEPSPDAIVARAAALAAGGNASSPGDAGASTIAGAVSGSSTESAASIGLRSQTIQLMRDAYFRACEGLLNGVIDSDNYKVILANADSVTVALAAVDALGGTTSAPAVAITAGSANAAVTPGSSTAAAGTGPGLPSVGTVVQREGKLDPSQANAIRAIALEIIKHAHQRELAIYRRREGSPQRRLVSADVVEIAPR